MKKSSKQHWLDVAHDILECGGSDLRRLASVAGADPAFFYRYQSLAECDLRGQDLRGVDLTGCEIERAIIDGSTRLDAKFDPRLLNEEQYITFYVTRSLNKLVLDFSVDAGYVYDAWAYKALIERGITVRDAGKWGYYEKLIRANPYMSALVNYKSKSSLIEKTIQVYGWQQNFVEEENFGDLTLDEALGWIMLVGAVSKRVRHNSRKDFSTVPPNALFPKRGINLKYLEHLRVN